MKKQEEKLSATILIVDDLGINVSILENIVQSVGYQALCALNVEQALEMMNETMPQLILSDYYMPDVDGLEFCRMMKKNKKTRDIPFLFITVADSNEEKKLAFEAGAVDYISKPFEPAEVIMRINNHLKIYYVQKQIEENNRMMHQVITEQRKGIEREEENLLLALLKIIHMKYPGTEEHLDRIGVNCRILAQSLQLSDRYEREISDAFVDMLGTAAKLHNIGTLVMQGQMDDSREAIEIHTEKGEALLKEISAETKMTRFLDMACEIAKYHHARWDGLGYPEVSGKEIPLAARIVAIIDDYDDLLREGESGRVDKAAAMEKIRAGSGSLYEPFMVDVFQKIVKQLKLPICD